MACHKCPACGFQYCDLDECPQCHGKGNLKKQIKDEKLKKALENIGGYQSDADHKNFIREDI